MMEHAPLIIRPKPDIAMFRWLLAMLANCSPERYSINKSRMLRLADYSRLCLSELRTETAISYDARQQGTVQLFRTDAQLEAAQRDMSVLEADGIPHRLLSRADCIHIEPALAHAQASIVGGLHTPQDETGDCFKFTQALEELTRRLGVDFRYGRSVKRIVTDQQRIVGLETDIDAFVQADAVVVAAGSYSPRLVRQLGIRLPVYPVKGYSLTIPMVEPTLAPQSTVLDETFKIAITRLGDRIRVGGMAEISGHTGDLPQGRRRTLEKSVTDLFPGGDLTKANFWSGLRPMTPDGAPVIGRTSVSGLFLNTGHGTLGWTMSTGSGKLLADIIGGSLPDIEYQDLGVSRYH
jgi:D-amino-acid dehydrogenase